MTYTKEEAPMRHGFSLLELLLVIFIISLVYFLGFNGIEKSEKKPAPLSPLTLKKSIMESSWFSGKGTLICVDKCQSCYFRKDIASAFEPYNGNIQLPETMEVYTVDAGDALQRVSYGRYSDKKICLRIDFYPNGSSTPLILKTDEGSYFLPSSFGVPEEVDSLAKAQERWLAYDHALDNQGDFY
jgi:prepilin-type N-terminal cleavage/methylation domain-containing protein